MGSRASSLESTRAREKVLDEYPCHFEEVGLLDKPCGPCRGIRGDRPNTCGRGELQTPSPHRNGSSLFTGLH